MFPTRFDINVSNKINLKRHPYSKRNRIDVRTVDSVALEIANDFVNKKNNNKYYCNLITTYIYIIFFGQGKRQANQI